MAVAVKMQFIQCVAAIFHGKVIFTWFKIFKAVQRGRSVKKIGQFLSMHISHTTNLIAHVYIEHKICKLDKPYLSDFTDTRD